MTDPAGPAETDPTSICLSSNPSESHLKEHVDLEKIKRFSDSQKTDDHVEPPLDCHLVSGCSSSASDPAAANKNVNVLNTLPSGGGGCSSWTTVCSSAAEFIQGRGNKDQVTDSNNNKDGACQSIVRSKLVTTRSSHFRGVSRNRWTGRYEAHLWDGNIQMEGRKRKGKLVYLGGYESEEIAGKAHDLAAIKYWGMNSANKLNYSVSEYQREIEETKKMSQEEYVASLIRKSSCFSRGASIYRGVTRKKDGRWQARICRFTDRKDIYLGTYNTEEEAAEAYDIAAVKLKGLKAVTNFDISNYNEDLEQFLKSR